MCKQHKAVNRSFSYSNCQAPA